MCIIPQGIPSLLTCSRYHQLNSLLQYSSSKLKWGSGNISSPFQMASSSMRFSHPARWPEVLHPADFGGYHSGRWFPSIRSSKLMLASKETFGCFWNLHSSYRYLTQPGSRLSIFYFETNSHLSLSEPSCHCLEPQKSQHASLPELLFTVKLHHYLTEVPLIPLSRSFAIWNFFWSPLQPFLANASTPLR